MSVSVPEFWKLVIDSRLLNKEQCQLLGAEFGRVKGAADQGNSKTLAQWLVSRNALTAYQATIIEAGRSGPFHYGDYKVYDRLETGPLSGAFRAIHEPTSHPVLLQFVAGAASQDADAWRSLVQRVQQLAAVGDPHLNRVFEPVDLETYKFIAAEDVPGESLGQRVAAGGRLQWSDACRAARAAALALVALHQAGRIHGDVRPQNIWLQPEGTFRLLVDPLFQPQPLHVERTDAASQLLLRADYMAPELAQQGKAVDALTDIYALGCSLYFLLSGQPPFSDGDVMQKLHRHATEPIQPLEQFGVPPQVSQLVTYMMAKNPAVRYQQMSVVAEQIAPYVDPAQLHIQPSPAATQSAYESWIKRKQSTLAATQSAAFPVLDEEAKAPVVQVDPEPKPAKTPAAPAVVADVPSTGTVSGRFASDRGSNKNTMMMIAGLSAVALIAIVLLVVLSFSGGEEEVAEEEPKTKKPATGASKDPDGDGGTKTPNGNGGTRIVNTSGSGTVAEQSPGDDLPAVVQEIVDDGKLPWAAPTTGPPINFDYVPQSTGIYLVARPADIVADSEGAKVLRALGPQFASARRRLEARLGVNFEQIEQLVVAVHENPGGPPRTSFRVTLMDAASEPDLLDRWNNPQVVPVAETDSNYYKASSGLSYFVLPHDAEVGVHRFLVGDEEQVQRVAEGEWKPLLQRDLEHLLEEWSDRQRHLTVLFTPAALLDETGQKLLAGDRAKLKNPIDWFLPRDHIQAGIFGAHLGESLYVELRMKSNLSKDAYELARDVQSRLEEVPDRVFNYITALGSNPYWERLRFKFPNMISELHRQTRIGTEKNKDRVATALVNSYLQVEAASNLVVATELAIASQPGAAVVAVAPKKNVPKDIHQLMQQTLDVIDIPQNDLVLAVQDVKNAVLDEYGSLPFTFDIKLMGNHLMANGITKNQKVTDFSRQNATYADILTGICMAANTITTVKDPSELDQKLIWVIAPETPGGDPIVLITTRDAAAANNYPLPEPFQPKPGS